MEDSTVSVLTLIILIFLTLAVLYTIVRINRIESSLLSFRLPDAGNVLERVKKGLMPQLAGASAARGPKKTIRLYSADWCGACQMFQSTWKSLEEYYSPLGQGNLYDNVALNKIDCTDREFSRNLSQRTQFKDGGKLTHFPTLTIQVDGSAEEVVPSCNALTFGQLIDRIHNHK